MQELPSTMIGYRNKSKMMNAMFNPLQAVSFWIYFLAALLALETLYGGSFDSRRPVKYGPIATEAGLRRT